MLCNYNDVSAIWKICLHLKDIGFPVLKDLNVTQLLGTDCTNLLIHRDFCEGQNGKPTAVKIVLGSVLLGGSKSKGGNCFM